MNNENYNDKKLISLQTVSWYLALILFGAVTVMHLMKIRFAVELAQISVVIMLILTLSKIFILIIKFKAVKLQRLVYLSYILLVILLSTVLIKYLL